MKFISILACCLLLPISVIAQVSTGPGLNTVDKFGSTARENKKFGYSHYKNHHDYMKWLRPGSVTTDTPDGSSCCGEKDCDIVRTFLNPDTQETYIIYDGYELVLPEEFRVRNKDNTYTKSPDGNSHACIAEWQLGNPVVLCWVLGDGFN